MGKMLIAKANDKKNQLIIQSIKEFKLVQEQLKKYQAMEKILKEQLKKYDFEEVVIIDENDEKIIFKATQYTQERKNLDKEKLVELLEAYIRADLGMGDDINDKVIPLKQDLEDIIESSYETKINKCIKFGVK